VELQTEMGNLPEIEVDEDQIKRVFMNLAVNGIQAMENGGGTLTVSTKQTKGFVEISFKDTGTGISMENLQKLFNPLFTTKARGMGMGLSICKKFVQGHGGSIEVETEEGKGSTFRVKLPLTQENGGENP
jgi:two-component system NtrC family sensor kinase